MMDEAQVETVAGYARAIQALKAAKTAAELRQARDEHLTDAFVDALPEDEFVHVRELYHRQWRRLTGGLA